MQPRRFILATPLMTALFCNVGCGNADRAVPAATTAETAAATPTAASDSPAPATAQAPTVTLAPTTLASSPYAWVGRAAQLDPNSWRMGWPATAVGVHFNGTTVSARLDLVDAYTSQWDSQFDVFVDAQEATALSVTASATEYLLASGLAAGEHTVWLVKRTEALVGSVNFRGFDVGTDGTLLDAPATRARRIEFVGASNETGYGDLAEVTADTMCTFSGSTQDVDTAYPKRVADALSADLLDFAYAGKGVYQDAYPDQDTVTLPDLYLRVDPNDANTLDDFSAPAPQAIVIDMGGNDFESSTPAQADFVAAYQKLLGTVRSHAPSAKIVCVMGPTMTGASRDAMRTYVNAAIQAFGDVNVSYYEFTEYTGSTFGCDYHPDADLHQAMADQLVPVLKQTLNW